MSDLFRLSRGTKLVLATHNDGKLKEFRELFAPFGLVLSSAGELGLPEPEETGTTFHENARLKAHASAQSANCIALSDDSGLCVDALNGDPGVYTADWAGEPRDFGRAMQRVEEELKQKGATDPSQRKAHFHATLCLALPSGEDRIFDGDAHGQMVWPPRGDLGFGYDPAFLPDGQTLTFGEMTSDVKHAWSPGHVGLSHRARAFATLVEAVCEL